MPPSLPTFPRADYSPQSEIIADALIKMKKRVDRPKKKRKTLGTAASSPNDENWKKRRGSRVAWPIPRRNPADENLELSGGEEEDFTISKPSTSSSCEEPEAKKGEYYVKNQEGIAAEKYSMVYRNNLHNNVDEDEESGDEQAPGTSGVITLNDRWKAEYNNGVQMLVHPESLPVFKTHNFHFDLKPKSPFKIPNSLITTSVDPDIPSASTDTQLFELPKERIYQGDEMDLRFLAKLNCSRQTANGEDWLKSETLLEILNALEVEAYSNIHEALLIPLHSPATYASISGEGGDEACDVCRNTESDHDDHIVFCDGCNMCVHMSCYGIESLPEGEWLCLKCSKLLDYVPPCLLCPTIGGAMKCTKNGDKWVHVACALWLPECRFGDFEKREPILAIEDINEERWQLKCSVCDTRQGACIQCSFKGCSAPFHVTCALRSGLTMKIECSNDPNDDRVEMISYCKKHSVNHQNNAQQSSDEKNGAANEQLRRLEKAFYLYADYDKVAKLLNLPQLLVSDVYEYWKQKRKSNDCQALISDPQDRIVVGPSNFLNLPDFKKNPTRIDRMKMNYEHRPANMIETKLEMFRNARVRLDQERNMMTLIIQREQRKRTILQADREAVFLMLEYAATKVISNRSAEALAELMETMMTPQQIVEMYKLSADPQFIERLQFNLSNKLPLLPEEDDEDLNWTHLDIGEKPDIRKRRSSSIAVDLTSILEEEEVDDGKEQKTRKRTRTQMENNRSPQKSSSPVKRFAQSSTPRKTSKTETATSPRYPKRT